MNSKLLEASTRTALSSEEIDAYNQEITRKNIRKILDVAKSVLKDIKQNSTGKL